MAVPQLLPQDHCALTVKRSGWVELVQVTVMSLSGAKVAPSEGAVRIGASGTLPVAVTVFAPLVTCRAICAPVERMASSWPI